MIIEDGTGKGYKVKVDSGNRIESHSTTETPEARANIEDRTAYSMTFGVIPASNGATIAYLKNESSKDVHVTRVDIWSTGLQAVDFYLEDTGTATNGTTIEPKNWNGGASDDAIGTFLTGTNIQGLTRGKFLNRSFYEGGGNTKTLEFPQRIILPPNKSFSLRMLSGSIETSGSIRFFYQDAE